MSECPQPEAHKRPWYSPKSFRTKFILIVGSAVVFDLILGGSVALWNVSRLGRDASDEIKHGLEKASNEYLENYIETTGLRANLLLGQVNSQVTTLANSMQTLIDHPEAKEKIGAAVADIPYFSGKLAYDAKGNWLQNEKGNASVLSVWGYLLDKDKKPFSAVEREIRDTSIFDLMSTSLMASGSRKLQMYYMGPKDRPIMRTTPYSDQAQTFDKLYAGHNEKNFWDFFFPGVYEGWQRWIKDPKTRPKDGYVTVTAPYVDAITGNLIVTFFHPLWNKERTDCEGAVAVDITLEQLSDLITDVRVAETGFAFLTMSNGNVLACTPDGEKTLGIAANHNTGEGVTGLDRMLDKSAQSQVAALRLPRNDQTLMRRIELKEGTGTGTVVEKDGTHSPDQHTEAYWVIMQRLGGMNLWAKKQIATDYLTLGFVVPENEIYASLYSAQGKVAQATERIRSWQLGILLISLAVVLGAVFSVSRRVTSGIIELATAARRIEAKDYSVRVDVATGDEVGALGHAFNGMAQEIEAYTTKLEQRVEERTQKLEAANREIQQLNRKLADENLRLGAELDVARRIQMMVLPKPEELQSVPRLDIAGHMDPATEVGGDYYDVLQVGSRVKIGIGDVTGHGLESGVLMLMVQSVARALLENGEDDPKRFLSVLNHAICKNIERTETDNNLTLSFIDYTDGTAVLTGQHEEVIVLRASGEVERIDTMNLGFPIGLEADIAPFLESRSLRFEAGDLMILYTDGVTEAESPGGELFGLDQLCDSAVRWRSGTASEVKDGIIGDLMAHIDTQKIHDDITLVVLKHL